MKGTWVVVLALLLGLGRDLASATHYQGRLVAGQYAVGPPEQVQVQLGHNATACVVSWTNALNATWDKAQFFVADEARSGLNASVLHAEVRYVDARYRPPTAEGLGRRHRQLAAGDRVAFGYASVYAEGRCGTTRLVSSVVIADCFRGRAVAYSVRNTQVQAGSQRAEPVTAWSPDLEWRLVGEDAPSVDVSVLGDMEVSEGAVVSSIHVLAADAQSSRLDAGLHLGDLAYDLDGDCGQRGDAFMRAMQPVTSRIAYLFGMGDHEAGRKSDPWHTQANGYDYEAFRMRLGEATNAGQLAVARRSGSPSLHFWSVDIGPLHVAYINTNAWNHAAMYWLLPIQFAWLERDLALVDRAKTPWLIVAGHRSLYCQSDGGTECGAEAEALRLGVPRADIDAGRNVGLVAATNSDEQRQYGLEASFRQHGVDLYCSGHTHHYERSWPVFAGKVVHKSYRNPGATVYVVSGIGGQSPDKFRVAPAAWNAYRDTLYRTSFGHVRVHNATHLEWRQRSARNGDSFDSFTLVRDQRDDGRLRSGSKHQHYSLL